MLLLVLIKSVLLTLSCVWILFYNASSLSCFRFLMFYLFIFRRRVLLDSVTLSFGWVAQFVGDVLNVSTFRQGLSPLKVHRESSCADWLKQTTRCSWLAGKVYFWVDWLKPTTRCSWLAGKGFSCADWLKPTKQCIWLAGQGSSCAGWLKPTTRCSWLAGKGFSCADRLKPTTRCLWLAGKGSCADWLQPTIRCRWLAGKGLTTWSVAIIQGSR